MKRHLLFLVSVVSALTASAQGWPDKYGGVMLQGFYWDSYSDTQWTVLESQADELSQSFSLIWIPQSGNCGGTSMGYDDYYWFSNYNSSFGTRQQLTSMISTFKSKGLKTLADVVINHRRNVSNWVDFPRETYKGVVYQMTSTDICANDDGGKTKTWASQNGYQLSANNDTGEGWDGMRDLDHKSENVQNCVKAYLDFLKNDLGYAGFRYDMVKGYSATFTGMYNKSAQPEFSVGECWDGTTTIRNWINGTKVNDTIQSAAFDFQFRYVVRNAANNGNWQALGLKNDGNWPLISSQTSQGQYRRYAVTFVENHDTEWRSNGERQDPLLKDTLAANAFMLAMPGTPCVFLKHWQDYAGDIKSMIAVRKAAGITNTSDCTTLASQRNYFAAQSDNRLLVVVGNTAEWTPEASSWVKVLEGYHYAYYLSPSFQTAWVDKASGTYEGALQVMLTAVTADAGARVVYTLDGSNPTAQSPSVASGTKIDLPKGTTVLKAALLVGGQVSAIIERQYVVKEKQVFAIPSFCKVETGEMCAFFEAPSSWTNTVKCWAWNSNANFTGGSWPGAACQRLGVNETTGKAVWKWSYTGTLTTQPSSIIFSNNGSPQTKDLAFENAGYYTLDGLISNVLTSIVGITAAKTAPVRVYTLDGRLVRSLPKATKAEATQGLPPGLYIVNHQKYLVK